MAPRRGGDRITACAAIGALSGARGFAYPRGSMSDLVGRTIGNYVVSREVGRGGMGTVYLAEHPRLRRRVAVKVLHGEMSRDPDIVTRFFNEARAASDIRNAHIVEILDFGELPDGTSTTGTTRDIAESGGLVVATEGGDMTVNAGDVVHLRAAEE